MNQQYCFTVFTPAYNHGHLLHRVYASLKAQSLQDFEWVVINDGSTDATDEVMKPWLEERAMPIVYRHQSNLGKHVAFNRAVELCHGYLFAVVDADSWLAPKALERMWHHWTSIDQESRAGFVGVVGLNSLPSGEVVGSEFPADVFDSDPIRIRTQYRVRGDKFGVNRVDLLRKFPFPEDLGGFVTEALVWNRIAQHYQTRFVNEVFAFTEYQRDGLSARSASVRASSAPAARLYYQEYITAQRVLPLLDLLRNYANYTRFSLHADVSLKDQQREVPSKWFWMMSAPIGAALYVRDRLSNR